MVFSSLVFLFAFLSIHLVVYFFAPKHFRNPWLLISSLAFYAWGGPQYLPLIMFESLASWFFALRIQSSQSASRKRANLVACCVVLLGLLAYFKYMMFLLGNIQFLTGVPAEIPTIILPIGISFYTFQLISYVADVYRGEVTAQPAYWKVLMYASLFHQCIAGPIIRYETVQSEIDNRRVTRKDVFYGVRRFCVGLAKKAILANSCAEVADTLLPTGMGAVFSEPTLGCWLGMIFYMFQIYFDFSAYSDMAIGLGRMVGFHYLENFNYPYMATSIKDFWRRWHISLSSFFRDYVYIPLGGSRCDEVLVVRNYCVVWFLTGLWHGASWNYIFWGLFYLGFLMLERYVIKGRIPRGLDHVYACLVVLVGWVLFRFEDMGELLSVLANMFLVGGVPLTSMEVGTLFLQNVFLLAFCIVACTNLGKVLRGKLFKMAKRNTVAGVVFGVTEAITPVVLLLLSVVSLAGATYNPFIYFQF